MSCTTPYTTAAVRASGGLSHRDVSLWAGAASRASPAASATAGTRLTFSIRLLLVENEPAMDERRSEARLLSGCAHWPGEPRKRRRPGRGPPWPRHVEGFLCQGWQGIPPR